MVLLKLKTTRLTAWSMSSLTHPEKIISCIVSAFNKKLICSNTLTHNSTTDILEFKGSPPIISAFTSTPANEPWNIVAMYDNPLSVAIVNFTETEEGESKKAMSLIEPAFLDQEMYRGDRLFRDVAL